MTLGVIYLAHKLPGIKIGVLTHTEDGTNKQKTEGKRLAQLMGYTLIERGDPWKVPSKGVLTTANDWTFDNGSTVLWTYVDGPATGRHLDLWFFDDLYKTHKQASSSTYREGVENFAEYVALARFRNSEAGTVVNINTRFHPLDFSWYLQDKYQATQITLPAISTNSKGKEVPLWPERHSLRALKKRQSTDPIVFDALYQGKPRIKGVKPFDETAVAYYTEVPKGDGIRYLLCADLAYTDNNASDFSVIACLAKQGDTTYLIDMWRDQVEVTALAKKLAEFQRQYPYRLEVMGNGQEPSVLTLIKQLGGPRYNYEATSDSKLERAMPLSVGWAGGKFLLPHHTIAPKGVNLTALLKEFGLFTGNNNAQNGQHDDMVDCISTGYNVLNKSSGRWLKADACHAIF